MSPTRLAAALLPFAFAACAPSVVLTDAEIPTAKDLGAIMWSQAKLVDPAFKRIDAAAYTDADWAAFSAAGKRLQISSAKLKESFSKGDGWNTLADTLGARAGDLVAAAEAKDGKAASTSLGAIRDTCRGCHKQYR